MVTQEEIAGKMIEVAVRRLNERKKLTYCNLLLAELADGDFERQQEIESEVRMLALEELSR